MTVTNKLKYTLLYVPGLRDNTTRTKILHLFWLYTKCELFQQTSPASSAISSRKCEQVKQTTRHGNGNGEYLQET